MLVEEDNSAVFDRLTPRSWSPTITKEFALTYLRLITKSLYFRSAGHEISFWQRANLGKTTPLSLTVLDSIEQMENAPSLGTTSCGSRIRCFGKQ